MEDHSEAQSPCNPWSTTVEQGYTLKPVEKTMVEQVDLKDSVACRELLLEQILGWTYSPWRGARAGAGDMAGAAIHGVYRLKQFAPAGWALW